MDIIDALAEAVLDVAERTARTPQEIADLIEDSGIDVDGIPQSDAPLERGAEDALEIIDLFPQTAGVLENLLETLLGFPTRAIERDTVQAFEQQDTVGPETFNDLYTEIQGATTEDIITTLVLLEFIDTLPFVELETGEQLIAEFLTLVALEDVYGRQIAGYMQEGLDPAIKQKAHKQARSKQADFQDFVEANRAVRDSSTRIQPREGLDLTDLPNYLNPADFGYLPDPDTYGTIPDQTNLFEVAGLEVTEPEELIEEPVQYGIPVPKTAIKQVTALGGIPKDAENIYLEVIEQLPKTENLIQDYVRLTEFTFRLRESVQSGAITPEKAVGLIEPELRDIIQDALPEDRLQERDRTAQETVDQLVGELRRNFDLLDSLPSDPPSQGTIEGWFRNSVVSNAEFQVLMDFYGPQMDFFGEYFEEQAIRQGADDIQTAHALGRLSRSDAGTRLELIGFSAEEQRLILEGGDPENIVQTRLTGGDGVTTLSNQDAANIGETFGQRLARVDITTLQDVAEASVQEITRPTGMSDQQAQEAIASAQIQLSEGEGS
jgi:hypothetical protein